MPRPSRLTLTGAGLYGAALILVGLWPNHIDEDINVIGWAPVQWMIRHFDLTPAEAYNGVEFGANVVLFVPLGLLAMRTPAQTLTAGPVAIPPLPPEPSRPAAPATQAGQRRVSPTGTIAAWNAVINVGYALRGTTVTAIRAGTIISIFDDRGTQIRSVQLQPGRRFYGNDQSRGPRPKKCPD